MSLTNKKKMEEDLEAVITGLNHVVQFTIPSIEQTIAALAGRLDQIEKRIDNLAHALTLAITAPANGATVSGTVTFTATCTCPSAHAIKSVCFYIWDERSGWVLIAEDTATPFTTTFDSKQYSNSSHKLRAVGACVSGGQSTQEITVTISNVIPTGGTTTGGGTASYGDVVSVQILTPVPGSRVPQFFNINVRASCSADHPISGVTRGGQIGHYYSDVGAWVVPGDFDSTKQSKKTFTITATCVHGTTGSVTATYYNSDYTGPPPGGMI